MKVTPALLLGVLLSASAHAVHVAVLDIGPGATEAQVAVIEEIGRRIGTPFEISVLPPRRAIRSIETGAAHLVGYVRPRTVRPLGNTVRLTVPVHVSRRGLFEGLAEAPDTVLLLRGFEYDEQTLARARSHSHSARVDDMDAVIRMLKRGRARYAIVDEFIMSNLYRGDEIRRLETVEQVTLHFAVAADAGSPDLAEVDGAICGLWADDFLLRAHRAFYPDAEVFAATRAAVLAEYCADR